MILCIVVCTTIFSCDLSTVKNNVNIQKITNVCDLLCNFNASIVINRRKIGSRKLTPGVYIKDLETIFFKTYDVKIFKVKFLN